MASFRAAREDEDDHLACIFYNAFLHIWDANWMQALSQPLPDVSIQSGDSKSLTPSQYDRHSLYLACIKLVRLLSGAILVSIPASTASNPSPEPSAALLWLPPYARPSFLPLVKSGLLYVLFFRFGLRAVWNTLSFEHTLEALNFSVLSPLGYKREACGFVFLLATNPSYRGQGHAAKLLEWQIGRHREELPGVPVVLDTTTDQAQKVYQRIGFRLLGKKRVESRADGEGIKLKKGEQTDEVFEQRVLLLE